MILSVDQCKTEFERARRHRRRNEPLQLSDLRWEALDRFLSLGFPTTRDQGWERTSVAAIAEQIFTLGAEPAAGANYIDLAPRRLPDMSATELVFVNGYYVPQASPSAAITPGVLVEPLSAVLDEHADDVDSYLAHVAPFGRHAFVALNTALFVDGACILIQAHTDVEQPIHLRFISTGEADMRPAMSHPRVLVILDEASRATIVESYVGPRGVPHLTNTVTEIVLGEDAVLDHCRVQHEGEEAYHISATYVVAARGAECSAHSISLGGALVRNDILVTLGGEGGTCMLNGLYLADGQRLVDHHTTIEHVMGRCRSREVFNGILAERATGVFDGTIIVRPDARKASATQTNRALLLSDEARSTSTPHLEISASEADCTQQAVVQKLDDDARAVIRAFAADSLNRLRLQPLRNYIQEGLDLCAERALA
jgi:Fe-S cluster assembly protein SufD